ncbi:2OG-Fe(II) oxygenase [Tistrella mobilis]|uniref:2OG-Fe(II) oxygenase n=1 Tax=Tistrella mobilis TaxID=171437 RepID=UPI0035570E51
MTPAAIDAFSAVPPHLVIRDAFGADMASRLLAFALAQAELFSETQVGNQKGRVAKQIRSSRVIGTLGALEGDLETKFRALLPRATAALHLAPFTLDSLSMELAAHGDGDFYRRHIDTFVRGEMTGTDRVLTAVYYFHATPRPFTGGELRLHSLRPLDQGGSYIDIEPVHDSLLLFPAWAPHEVCPVSCPGGSFAQSRFAINCWYNSRAH